MTGKQFYHHDRFVPFDMSKPIREIKGQFQCQTCYCQFNTMKDLRDHVTEYQVSGPWPPVVQL